jgi:alpha-L-fucosidase
MSHTQLIRLLCDVVARNGNLLLGIGPRPDGTLDAASAAVLAGLGSWLSTNGEAIYGSRPWVLAESVTTDGAPVRFTRSGEAVYALVLGMPASRRLTLRGVDGSRTHRVRLVGMRAELEWCCDPRGDLTVTLPEHIPLSAVTVLDLGSEVRARLRSQP